MTYRKAFPLVALSLIFLVLSSQQAAAQEGPSVDTLYFKPELFVSIGRVGELSLECCPAAWASLGGGVALRLSRRFGVEVEGNRVLGAELSKVFGVVLNPDGTTKTHFEAREGVSSLTLASGNILFYFSNKRVQPYLSGGVGAIWERGTRLAHADVTELDYHHNDLAGVLGGGVRISITPRISVRPEFRLYGAYRQAGFPHTIARASIAAAYRW